MHAACSCPQEAHALCAVHTVIRLSRLQQPHALVDVVWGQQPEFVQADEVHDEDAPQLHAPQNVVPVVVCEGLTRCWHLPHDRAVFVDGSQLC